jgi:Flp pilus assembly protein TadD
MEPQQRILSTLVEKFNRRTAHVRGRTIAIVAAAAVLSTGLVAGCRGKSVNDYLSEGDAAMQKTDLPQAEQSYQAAVKAAPADPRVHVALGNLYVFEQKPTLAQAEFMRVLELEPANPAAHSALGGLYESAGQMGAAEEQFLAAVTLKPTDPAYRLQLAALLAKRKREVRAEVELRTAIGLQPKDAQAHLALANLLNANPDTRADAEAEFAEVRALDPHLLAAPVTAVSEAPGAAPSPQTAAAPPPTTPAVKEHKLKPIDRKFKLTKNSPVYQAADGSTSVVGQVHRGHFVHVTGIEGEWLQVTLRNGTVGYIPVAAAE